MDKQPLPRNGHCGHCSGVVIAEDLQLLPGLGVARGTGSLRKVEGNPFLVCVTGISPCTSALIFSCPYLRCFALICLCLFPLHPNWCPPLVPRPVITPAPPCSLFLLCSHPTAETTRTQTQAANTKEDDAISECSGSHQGWAGNVLVYLSCCAAAVTSGVEDYHTPGVQEGIYPWLCATTSVHSVYTACPPDPCTPHPPVNAGESRYQIPLNDASMLCSKTKGESCLVNLSFPGTQCNVFICNSFSTIRKKTRTLFIESQNH